jgi:hypothetical protein
VKSAVLRLLSFVDELPFGATGALYFGARGVILVESRKVCWALARGMPFTLTEILREQSTPPLSLGDVEAVYRRCKQSGQPIGEALLQGGLVTARGLKAALLRHSAEAVAELALAKAEPEAFLPHARAGYNAQFSFSTSELLAMFGSRDDPERAAAAQHELASSLVPGSVGVAFTCNGASSKVIAVDPTCDLPVTDLTEICVWVAGMFDVARTVDPGMNAARATWGANTALVTWSEGEVGYVGVCVSRAAAACLLSQVSQRFQRGTGVSGVMRRVARTEDGA